MPIVSKLKRILGKTKIEVTLEKRAKDPDTEEIYATIKCVGDKTAKDIRVIDANVKSKTKVHEVPPEIVKEQADPETIVLFLSKIADYIDKHYQYMKTVVDTKALKKILSKKTVSPTTQQHLKALARWLAKITCPEVTNAATNELKIKELKPGGTATVKIGELKKAVVPRLVLYTTESTKVYVLPPGNHQLEIVAKGSNTVEAKAKIQITVEKQG